MTLIREIISNMTALEMVGAVMSMLSMIVIIVGVLFLTYGFGG
jgi:hypothetical protein